MILSSSDTSRTLMHLFFITNSGFNMYAEYTGFNMYAEYTQPQLTFLALLPWSFMSDEEAPFFHVGWISSILLCRMKQLNQQIIPKMILKELSLCHNFKFQKSLYLCNPMLLTFDILNLDCLIPQSSKFDISKVYNIVLHYDICRIRKLEFVAKTQLL